MHCGMTRQQTNIRTASYCVLLYCLYSVRRKKEVLKWLELVIVLCMDVVMIEDIQTSMLLKIISQLSTERTVKKLALGIMVIFITSKLLKALR